MDQVWTDGSHGSLGGNVCVFNWCTNSQPLRKWPLGGSSKWHTNIYHGCKHLWKPIYSDLFRHVECGESVSGSVIQRGDIISPSSAAQLAAETVRWLISVDEFLQALPSLNLKNSLYWWVQMRLKSAPALFMLGQIQPRTFAVRPSFRPKS